jgi:hypothetical protein
VLRGNVLLATLAAKSLTVAEIGDRSPTFRRISHTASYLPARPPGHPLWSSLSWYCHGAAHIHHVEPTGRRLQVCRADRRRRDADRADRTRRHRTRIARIKQGRDTDRADQTKDGTRINADQTKFGAGRGSTRIKPSSGRDADLTEDVRPGRGSHKPSSFSLPFVSRVIRGIASRAPRFDPRYPRPVFDLIRGIRVPSLV